MTEHGSDPDIDGERNGQFSTVEVEAAVEIERPPVELAERLAGWWVALADEQRTHSSRLLGEPNRALVKEAMARHIVTDGLLVARRASDGSNPATDDRARTDAHSTDGSVGPDDPGPDPLASGDPMGVVGFVMFGPETGSYEQAIDRGIVENVYVHPDYRNRGIGTALLDAAERALIGHGVDAIALEAMADNEAARRLYERRGYSPHRVELEAPVSRLDPDERAEGDLSGDDGSERNRTEDERTKHERTERDESARDPKR